MKVSVSFHLWLSAVNQNNECDSHDNLAALRACYRKAGVEEQFRARLYDTPHELNAAMQAEAWDWLRKWV